MTAQNVLFHHRSDLLPHTTRIRHVVRIWVAIGMTGLSLLLGEIVTRAFITSPSRQTFDAELGFHYLPHAEIYYAEEGGARLQLNSLGFNDDEIGPKDRRTRVAFVGDSMTEALQVERSENFVGQLKKLRPDLDFVNLGQSAAGPLEYRVILDRFRDTIAPDITVFAFSEGDFADLAKSRFKIERGLDGSIQNISLQAKPGQGFKRTLEPVLHRSALATLIMRRVGRMSTQWSGLMTNSSAELPTQRENPELAEVLAFVLTKAAARGPMMAIFLPQLEYKGYRQSQLSGAAAEETSLFRQAAAKAGIPFFAPDQELREQFLISGNPGHGFPNMRIGTGHLNRMGHAAVAQSLARHLSQAFPAGKE